MEYGSESGGVWNMALRVEVWNMALRVEVCGTVGTKKTFRFVLVQRTFIF